jgi:hypothetical protein
VNPTSLMRLNFSIATTWLIICLTYGSLIFVCATYGVSTASTAHRYPDLNLLSLLFGWGLSQKIKRTFSGNAIFSCCLEMHSNSTGAPVSVKHCDEPAATDTNLSDSPAVGNGCTAAERGAMDDKYKLRILLTYA